MKSAYHNIFFYPILDIRIDWTSLIGISQDGVFLMDAEMNVAYMYLPFAMIESIESENLVLTLHLKDLIN